MYTVIAKNIYNNGRKIIKINIEIHCNILIFKLIYHDYITMNYLLLLQSYYLI